jgi:hypothetical protein
MGGLLGHLPRALRPSLVGGYSPQRPRARPRGIVAGARGLLMGASGWRVTSLARAGGGPGTSSRVLKKPAQLQAMQTAFMSGSAASRYHAAVMYSDQCQRCSLAARSEIQKPSRKKTPEQINHLLNGRMRVASRGTFTRAAKRGSRLDLSTALSSAVHCAMFFGRVPPNLAYSSPIMNIAVSTISLSAPIAR